MPRHRNAAYMPGSSPQQPVRMIDVARLAGVSAQTVSRTISRPALVSAATRAMVRKAIDRLSYIPNSAARNLATSASRIVAAVIPTLSNSVYAEEVSHMTRLLEAEGYSVLIGDSEYSLEREGQLIQSFLERRPEAMILTGTEHSRLTRRLIKQSGVLTIETWNTDAPPIELAVGFSNIGAGLAMGNHLVSRGYRAIAFVGGAEDQDYRGYARYLGLAKAVKEAGLPTPPAIAVSMPPRKGDGIAGLERLLSTYPKTDAVFFSSDALALNAMLECLRRGIPVPKRLAICGFGDYEYSDQVQPRLTTIQIPAALMGETAAHMILESIHGKKLPERKVDIGFQLVAREST